jgi:hypothetical protein
MYLGDRQLGSDLTDNSYEDDGYRYHDIMHLANVAKLGWSPVLRGLMGLKRKGNPRTDEVEDGARAQIVEEAVIKAIHSEGQRIAGLLGPPQPNVPRRLFPSNSDITFRFLKFVRNFVADLEVHGNRYWEWEDAILAGYDIFHRLRLEGQGTVAVDLNSRTLTFKPEVCINLVGRIAGLGSAYFDSDMLACDTRFKTSTTDASRLPDRAKRIRNAVQQLAVLDALEIRRPGSTEIAEMEITEVEGRGISVKATGSALRAMWNRNVVAVRTTVSLTASGGAYCAAIAVAN